MWNVKTSVMIRKPLERHDGVVNSVAISPDGTKIASSSYDEIQLWSVKSQAPIGKPLEGHLMSHLLRFHMTAHLSSGFADGIQLWNVETGAKVGDPLHDHTDFVTSVACSPDGVHIASGSRGESVRLWNMGDILCDGPGFRHIRGPHSR